MCFSATASFTASAALLTAGSYCVTKAWRQGLKWVPLALVPFAFCAQQFSEGLVWHGLENANGMLVQRAAQVFLFFAIAFWPLWMALCLAPVADERNAKLTLLLMAGFSLIWFWLYFPLATDPDHWLTVHVAHHSIRYEYDDLPGFGLLNRNIWRVGYLLAICVPFYVCQKQGQPGEAKAALWAGSLVAIVFLVSALVFWYAFTSVWCFFAAVLSLALAGFFYQISKQIG
jgi:hypothetical protein